MLKTLYKAMTQENIQRISAGRAFLHALLQPTGLWVNCCVFRPAFRCLQQLKAGQTSFFSRFQPFLLTLNLFQ